MTVANMVTSPLLGGRKTLDVQRELASFEHRLWTAVQTAVPDQTARISVVAVKEGEIAPRCVVAEVARSLVREEPLPSSVSLRDRKAIFSLVE